MGRVELGTANEVRKLTTALSEAVRDFVAKKRGACTDDEMMEWTAEQLSGLLRHMDGALCNTTAVGGSAQGPGDSPTRKRQRTAADAPTAEDAQLEREVVGLADRVVALRETVPAVLAVHVSEQLLAVRPAADGIASLAGEVEAADSARAGAAGAPAARELGDKFGALVRLLPGLRARLEGAVNRIERVVAAVEEEGARDGGPGEPRDASRHHVTRARARAPCAELTRSAPSAACLQPCRSPSCTRRRSRPPSRAPSCRTPRPSSPRHGPKQGPPPRRRRASCRRRSSRRWRRA
ncbi:unnamed protein product [Pedinophyceae sp. YPF-701]|nr:unnamed protein product [Pedinophyceae sp. YPF-701]